MIATTIWAIGYVLTWRKTVAWIAWFDVSGQPCGVDWALGLAMGTVANTIWPIIYTVAGIIRLYKKHDSEHGILTKIFPKPKVLNN